MTIPNSVGIIVTGGILSWIVYSRYKTEASSVASTKAVDLLKRASQIVGRKGLGWIVGISVVVLIFVFVLKPWVESLVDRNLRDDVVRQTQAQVRAELAQAHNDTENEVAATEDKPLRVVQRSRFDRILIEPIGYVSYKVMYPSPVDGSFITVIRGKKSAHVDLPPSIKWAEYRPLDTDSVIFIVRRHEQK